MSFIAYPLWQDLGLPSLPPLHQALRGLLLDSAPCGAVSSAACVQSLVQSVAALVALALASEHQGSEESRREAELKSKRAVGRHHRAAVGGEEAAKM